MKDMFLKKSDIYYQKWATVAQRFQLLMTKLGEMTVFYFARAVSHAAVQTDRLCYIRSQLSPRPAINRFNLCTVPEKLTTLQAGTQKDAGKKEFRAGSESSTQRAILGAKIDFLACFF